MTRKQRAQVVELLRCGADVENFESSNLYEVACRLHMRPYLSFADTKVVHAAHQRTFVIWGEVNSYTWRDAMLEAAQRLEEGSLPMTPTRAKLGGM
jgi:hypothetical protein